MGEAKQRRQQLGVTDERTEQERQAAFAEEFRRMERHKNGEALSSRLRWSFVGYEHWPNEAKRFIDQR